jgi:hypothetical protein
MNIIQFALIGLGAMVSMGAAAEQRSPEAVVAQEQAWADALLKADMATVADLMHPHFRLVRTFMAMHRRSLVKCIWTRKA